MVILNECITIEAPIARCFDLARSIEVHLRGTKSFGERAIGGVTTGLIGLGEFVRWRAKHLGFYHHLASEITALESPTYFQDTMTEGPFRAMKHDHFFKKLSENSTEMRDCFMFSAPVPILGVIAEKLVLKRYMANFLHTRNRVLKQIAESDQWQEFLPH
jgi:ligand-binding SRPBCC domain-containing protein